MATSSVFPDSAKVAEISAILPAIWLSFLCKLSQGREGAVWEPPSDLSHWTGYASHKDLMWAFPHSWAFWSHTQSPVLQGWPGRWGCGCIEHLAWERGRMLWLFRPVSNRLPEWELLLSRASQVKDSIFFDGGPGILWVTEFLLTGAGSVFQFSGFPSWDKA